MVFGSPGGARSISGRGTGLNPGPELMPSVGANHGGNLRRAAGAAEVRGKVSSGAEWLSVPMRIEGGRGWLFMLLVGN